MGLVVFASACAQTPPQPPGYPESNATAPASNTGGILEAPFALVTVVSHAVRHANDDSSSLWFGTDVRIESDHVRWRRCDEAQQCSTEVETAPIGDLLGVEAVGVTNGVEVKQLRFRANSPTEDRLKVLAARRR